MEEAKECSVIDIEAPLEVSLKERLQKTLRWKAFEPFTLSRVPQIIRESNKDLYEPRVVSIGPYHRGSESLGAMEAHKPRCLLDLLEKNLSISLDAYVHEMRALESRARRCYSESITLTKDEFVEMLLLDGCFILEFFHKVRQGEPHVLLDVGWGNRTIISDLLLFENQIPFFVLEKLYTMMTNHEGGRDSLLYLLHPCSIEPDLQTKGEIFHLLHLYHQWFIPGPRNSNLDNPSLTLTKHISSWLRSRNNAKKPSRLPLRCIPCATELREAGVTFRRKKHARDVFDITFENGVMEIPTLLIDLTRKVFYVNLAAFEQSRGAMEHTLMSYAALMDSLINTKNDVVLLQRCGVINNVLLNEEELAVFFNHLGDYSTLDFHKHYFAKLFADVQEYYDQSWHRYRARLIHDYFNSPWSAISVIAAIVLLIFSAIQAIYAVYPYMQH